MTEQQISNLNQKLPKLLKSFIKSGRKDEVLESMVVNEEQLDRFIEGTEFPNEKQLKEFCNHFKLMYSTIKTWDVTHLTDNP